jgi:death-on-curing protein
MEEPVWISLELATTIHERQLAEHGGPPGIRDEAMLESALGRARHRFAYSETTPEIPTLAAAYAYGIARNHPFVDGNKRTAAVLCEVFMELNGFRLVAEDSDLYPVFMALAAGELEEDELAAWLSSVSRPEQVSEPSARYA